MSTVRILVIGSALLGAVLILSAQAATDPAILQSSDDGVFADGLVVGLTLAGAGVIVTVGALYFLGVGGLRHVDKRNVLEHPLRQNLLKMVQEQPGIHLRELANSHGTAVTNTQWHLRKLELAELVRTQKVQGRRLYYPAEGGIEARSQAIQNAAVRNPNAEKIFDWLQDNSGCNQRTLAEGLEMNPGTVRWHLRKLEAAGLIRSVPDGTQTRYFTLQRPPRPMRHREEQAVSEQVEVRSPSSE